MKSGVCPKCGAQEVYNNSHFTFQGIYYRLPLGGFFGRAARTHDYVCAECGYIERYVANFDDRDKIKRKWTKVVSNRR